MRRNPTEQQCAWYDNPAAAKKFGVSADDAKNIREKAFKFIEWLRCADLLCRMLSRCHLSFVPSCAACHGERSLRGFSPRRAVESRSTAESDDDDE